jgi:hypothetical protein
MQFPVETLVEGTENTRNDRRPEYGKKERREEIEKQKKDKDHNREKKYMLDF